MHRLQQGAWGRRWRGNESGRGRLRFAVHDETPSFGTVYYGFKRGHNNLTDDLSEGRPSTVTTDDNVSAVRLMIETDKTVIYQLIQTSLGIGMSQLDKILYEKRSLSYVFSAYHIISPTLKNFVVLIGIAKSYKNLPVVTQMPVHGMITGCHPPYSLDIAPVDFYLFPKMKKTFRGKWLTYAEEAVAPHEKAVETTPKFEWAKSPSEVPLNAAIY
ncbi:hypothetical protein EVAR_63811_1 [Eumeta japonica]|uniref:Uncharacterized protein n=1 Tax=Eumeta variegata TaxID=151549 RepID=A0A4C2A371_EUMVA|nr:hypothetical protein EVAR_63811_1 [Eumeta japonica]